MDYITEILSQNKSDVERISNIIKDYKSKKIRYEIETSYLRFIVINQLNLSKNRVKGPLEKITIDQLFCLLLEEIYELKAELLDLEQLDAHRILSEIGDIGAFLVGITAKILKDSKDGSNLSVI